MNSLGIAIRAEIYVALRSFAGKLILVAPCTVIILQFVAVKLTETGQQARDSLLGSSNFEDLIANNAYGYFVDGLTTGLTILGLLLVGLSAYSFSYERDIGVIRHLVIRRVSRTNLILAKLIYLHVLALLSLLLMLVVSYVGSGFFWEFGPIVEDGFELISVAEIQAEIGLGLKLAILPLPAAIAFGLFISVLSHSATAAVSTALGVTLAIDIFKAMLGDFAYYLYATFQPSLIDQSYLQDVSRIVRGYSDVLVDERIHQLNTWVPLPSMLLFLAAALWIVHGRKL
jgi:ABC-type transport system involved in multi-copper enzyme maturation permease subunit